MNYKIRVANETESKEAQELLFALGGEVKLNDRFGMVCLTNGRIYADDIKFFDDYSDCKELTIPQLKDLVVLKRNDVSDATHCTESCGAKGFLSSEGIEYFWEYGVKEWNKHKHSNFAEYEMKPITKEPIMKEYLNKLEDGTYKLVVLDSVTDGVEGLIEVPGGATSYNQYTKGESDNEFFIKLVGDTYLFANEDTGYMWEWYGGSLNGSEFVLWQRETLNDKVASAEVARQEFIGAPFSDLPEFNFEAVGAVKHSHYKKDISHLNVLDIYRVTELFNPHSCGAHIAKKALCSGQRGHKDLLTDIQDIIDTAERWKEMLIEDEKAK